MFWVVSCVAVHFTVGTCSHIRGAHIGIGCLVMLAQALAYWEGHWLGTGLALEQCYRTHTID